MKWSGLLALYLEYLDYVDSFTSVPPTHRDSSAWLSGKYDFKNIGSKKSVFNPESRFDKETLHKMKKMCSDSLADNNFIMSYDDAYNLLREKYLDFKQITAECKVTD